MPRLRGLSRRDLILWSTARAKPPDHMGMNNVCLFFFCKRHWTLIARFSGVFIRMDNVWILLLQVSQLLEIAVSQ